jgi:type II secretory pathway predicted ATPase ExeA
MAVDFELETSKIEKWQKDQGWKVKDPFIHITDPFLFVGFDDILTKLYHFATMGRNYAAIYGHYGFGKTVLLKKFAYECSKKYNALFFEDSISLDLVINRIKSIAGNRILRLLGLQMINGYDFVNLNEMVGRKTILIFDEAHSLDNKIFAYLRSLSEAGTVFSVVFGGKPELIKPVGGIGMPQYILDRLDFSEGLRPLNYDESLNLVKRRVELVAISRQYLLTDNAILLIAENTRYVPRELLEACSKFVDFAIHKELHKIDDKVVEKNWNLVVRRASTKSPIVTTEKPRKGRARRTVIKRPFGGRSKETKISHREESYSIDRERFIQALSPLQARIIEYLFKNEERTAPEIAKGVSDKYDTVRHMLRRLQGKYDEPNNRMEIKDLFPLITEKKNPNGRGYIYSLSSQVRKIMSLD